MTYVYFDGASESTNPGPSAWGIAAVDAQTGLGVYEDCGALGHATNNVAEFAGLEAALSWALLTRPDLAPFIIRGDSEFVVKTIMLGWRTHKPHLVEPTRRTRELAFRLGAYIEWVPRERNTLADRMSKVGLSGVGGLLSALIDEQSRDLDQGAHLKPRISTGRNGRSVKSHDVPCPPNLRRSG